MIFLKRLMILCLLVVVGMSGFLFFEGYENYQNAMEHNPLENKVEEVYQKQNYMDLEKIPPFYKNVMTAVQEDGHTITKQLAKNLYFREEQSMQYRIAEIFLAREIERIYEKEEILELYINIIPNEKESMKNE